VIVAVVVVVYVVTLCRN